MVPEARRDCPIPAARRGRELRYLRMILRRTAVLCSRTAILLGLALAGLLAGCSSGHLETKVGGAWPTLPVKCSAYLHNRVQYDACLARDREATAAPTGAASAGAPRRPEPREG